MVCLATYSVLRFSPPSLLPFASLRRGTLRAPCAFSPSCLSPLGEWSAFFSLDSARESLHPWIGDLLHPWWTIPSFQMASHGYVDACPHVWTGCVHAQCSSCWEYSWLFPAGSDQKLVGESDSSFGSAEVFPPGVVVVVPVETTLPGVHGVRGGRWEMARSSTGADSGDS